MFIIIHYSMSDEIRISRIFLKNAPGPTGDRVRGKKDFKRKDLKDLLSETR